jgi:ring-1,2-phenylacetyl-CoA epoxidase subunit PaaE
MAQLEYHPLRVTEVAPLTGEAVALTLDVPDDLAPSFRYLPGQHMVVRAIIDGVDVRRSYSICANANSGKLRIGIKRLAGGVFSTWATTVLKPGDTLEVMPPIGDFVIECDPTAHKHRCAIVAGSGITPVLSLVSTSLESEPESRWTVIFGNRRAGSVMFLDELEGLKDRYRDRLHLIHVLSQEETVPILSGRIDRDRLEALFSNLVNFGSVDEWFLCGPTEMVNVARTFIEGHGVDPSVVHDEQFFAAPPTRPLVHEDETTGSVILTFTLEGRSSTVRMNPEQTILDAALAVRSELPFSCRGGMCATCKAKVLDGEIRMDKNWALVDADLEQGFALTCQAHPLGERIVVDFDQR